MQPPLLTRLLPLLLGLTTLPVLADPERYVIDRAGRHAYIEFSISHLGFSMLRGRFNDFEGSFTFDPDDPAASRVQVRIDPASVDSNHAERDRHLRGEDFLDVRRYPSASFMGHDYRVLADGRAELRGRLTLRGITRELTLAVQPMGHGPDPWGGYRRGFTATTRFPLADFGIDYNLGPQAREVEIQLSIEGIRQD